MKIIPNYPNVVIGSRTVTEYKFQILNFMNLIKDSIEKDNDFHNLGYSNLAPWCDNLKYEIGRVAKDVKICNRDIGNIYSKLDNIQTKLRINNSKSTKQLCLNVWNDLLEKLTKVFDLKYLLI